MPGFSRANATRSLRAPSLWPSRRSCSMRPGRPPAQEAGCLAATTVSSLAKWSLTEGGRAKEKPLGYRGRVLAASTSARAAAASAWLALHAPVVPSWQGRLASPFVPALASACCAPRMDGHPRSGSLVLGKCPGPGGMQRVGWKVLPSGLRATVIPPAHRFSPPFPPPGDRCRLVGASASYLSPFQSPPPFRRARSRHLVQPFPVLASLSGTDGRNYHDLHPREPLVWRTCQPRAPEARARPLPFLLFSVPCCRQFFSVFFSSSSLSFPKRLDILSCLDSSSSAFVSSSFFWPFCSLAASHLCVLSFV